MLGSAPGTDRLNEWVDAIDDGMSLEDIANEIAGSDAFTTAYPTFLTNEEFATDFLNNLMGSEDVPAALVSAAVSIVTGLLNDGMTRGALALAVFAAMYEIHDQGEAHAAYADLGMVANGLFNKIEVAEYYTVDLRQESSNSRVLRDVNSETGLADIMDSIGDHLDPPDPILLTNQRDNVVGTAANDLIVAEPDKNGNDTLDPFDVIDGGPGSDSLEVYSSGTEDIDIDVNGADVTNVERVYLSTRGAIDVDLTGWEGLETVELGRFGAASDVNVKVNGASVSTARTFGGAVTIVGAAGEASVMAGKTSAIKIGSGAHTTSVMTKGGASVDVNKTGAGGQSDTVTSVMIDGVQRGLGNDNARGTAQEPVGVTIAAGNDALSPSATVTQYVTWDATGTSATAVSDADAAANTYYIAAAQPDAGTGNFVEGMVAVVTEADDAQMQDVEGAADMVSVKIMSDAIEHVSLSNNDAIVAVINESDDPEDLMVTVNKYGGTKDNPTGKLCIKGDGSAENVSIMVDGDSNFYLASDEVKSINVMGDGALTLDVNKFDNATASDSLESLTLSGSGKFTMKDATGLSELASIDASGATGDVVIFKLGSDLTSYDGGSAFDCIEVSAFATAGVMVDLGGGNDAFKSAGGNDKSRVDGGDGMDTLQLTGASATHKVDGKDVSIFSNFEILDIGGSAEAAHDIKLLGVGSVIVSASTTGAVTLNNMADGMGISVNGKAGMAAIGTDATVIHNMAGRSAGDPRYSGVLDVVLTANGSKDDAATAGTGAAKLTVTADEEIETLSIESNANPAGKAAAATYQNTLVLMGADNAAGSAGVDSNVMKAIVVSGSARAMVSATTSANGAVAQFANLELIDAEDNTGGVTFSALIDVNGTPTALTQALEMSGGSGKDMFTGGDGADELMGNGGGDTLNGGGGDDTITGGAGGDTMTGGSGTNTFKYGSVSESQIVFGDKGPSGFDTITDWDTGTDNVISLGRTVFNGLNAGTLRELTAGNAINSRDDDTDGTTTANSLQAFLGKGEGVFETRTDVTDGVGQTVAKNPITTVTESYYRAARDDETADFDADGDGTNDSISLERTWVLIDVDGDGDFDASVDMVIALTGTVDMTAGDFGV